MAFKDPETAERMIREDLDRLRQERAAIAQQIAAFQQRDAELAEAVEKWEAVLADDTEAK